MNGVHKLDIEGVLIFKVKSGIQLMLALLYRRDNNNFTCGMSRPLHLTKAQSECE
jgi:hypothetical protein